MSVGDGKGWQGRVMIGKGRGEVRKGKRDMLLKKISLQGGTKNCSRSCLFDVEWEFIPVEGSQEGKGEKQRRRD